MRWLSEAPTISVNWMIFNKWLIYSNSLYFRAVLSALTEADRSEFNIAIDSSADTLRETYLLPVLAVVKVACLECRRSRVRAPLRHSSFKETKCFFPAHRILWGASVTRCSEPGLRPPVFQFRILSLDGSRPIIHTAYTLYIYTA